MTSTGGDPAGGPGTAAEEVASDDPPDPGEVGPYRLLRRLGRGRLGPVHLAEGDTGPVVVRILDPVWIEDVGGAAALARSLTAVRRLPPGCGIARVVDAALSGSTCYVVSEFVPGPTVADLVASSGPLDAAALTALARASIAAVRTLHEAGLAHGRVHPRRVRAGPDGPRLLGAGLLPAAAHRPRPAGTVASGTVASGTEPHRPDATPLPHREESTRAAQQGDIAAWAATVAFAATGDPAVLDPRAGPGVAVPGALDDLLRACRDPDPMARPTARQVLERWDGAFAPGTPGAAAAGPDGGGPRDPGPPPAGVGTVSPDAVTAPPPSPDRAPAPYAERAPAERRDRQRSWRPPPRRRVVQGMAGAALVVGALGVGAVLGAASSPGRTDAGGTVRGTPGRAAEPRRSDPSAGPGTGEAPPGSCTAGLALVATWPGGFKAEVTVTAVDGSVRGWQVSWVEPRGQTVRQSWNVTLTRRGASLEARNLDYNASVPAGSATTFGLVTDGPATPPAGAVTCRALG